MVEDILHGWLKVHLKPFTEGLLARSVTALLAVVSIVMLIVIQKLGGVLGKLVTTLLPTYLLCKCIFRVRTSKGNGTLIG